MRHDSNWLDYLRKLANEGGDAPHRVPHISNSGHEMASRHAAHHRDEWLQAGYTAQMTLPFRSNPLR